MRRLLLFALAGASWCCTPDVALADPVAIIASLKGKVTVQSARGAEPATATFGRALEAGDRVQLAAGAAATILFNDGNVAELGERSTLTIGGAPKGGKGGGKLPGDVFAQVAKLSTGGSRKSGLVVMAPMRSGGTVAGPEPIAPRQTDVLSDRPTFEWRAVEGAERYRIALSGDDGEMWNREVTSTTLAYPADVAAIAPDHELLWEVQAFGARGALGRASAGFRVPAKTDLDAVRAVLERIRAGGDTPATHYLAGSYLHARGYQQDALAEFKALARSTPTSPAPHEALGDVYRALGLMEQAAAAYDRALDLTHEH
ncbi:MAG: tetratricopeptide repeat protein [Candidatus Eisenbacteria bacterium]